MLCSCASIQILSVASKSLQRLFIKLSMLILGVRFDITPANLRRLGLGAAGAASDKDKDKASNSAAFAPGDVVLVNFTNVFEVSCAPIIDAFSMPCGVFIYFW